MMELKIFMACKEVISPKPCGYQKEIERRKKSAYVLAFRLEMVFVYVNF